MRYDQGVTDAGSTHPPDRRKIDGLVFAYSQAFAALKESVDRSPHNQPMVHAVSNLLTSITQPFSQEEIEIVLAEPAVKSRQFRMWEFLSQAEAAMERYYSVRLDASNVHQFRYFRKSYDMIVNAELHQLGYPATQLLLKPNQSIVFVEAGPLPVSAILMHQKAGVAVTCIDSSRANADLGRSFVEKCGLSDHINYRCAEGDDFDYSAHPIAFVSSYVRHKASILENICEESYGVETLAVRSAQGIYTLLYEPVTVKLATALSVRFDRQTEATPETINTTLFASLLKLPEIKPVAPQAQMKAIVDDQGNHIRDVDPEDAKIENLRINVRRRPKGKFEPD